MTDDDGAKYRNLMTVLASTRDDSIMHVIAAVPELRLTETQAAAIFDELLLHFVGPPAYRTVRCTAPLLNVRGWPAIEQNVVGQIAEGDTAQVFGKADGWLLIRTEDGVSGWAAAEYLENLA